MAGEEQPPGFRFYPTEEELISFYLRRHLSGTLPPNLPLIPVFHLYRAEPWDLPKSAGALCRDDTEQWFFFVPRQERESQGGRPSRTTATGYWKATGSPVYVYSSDSRVIGVKKTMVFYKGRAPTGTKTKWKMNEYRAIDEVPNPSSSTSIIPKLRYEFSLCRVYVVSGSFRAFDRRPTTSDEKFKTVKTTTSLSETSCSAPDMAGPTENCVGSTSNSEMIDEQKEPIWEWNKLEWL